MKRGLDLDRVVLLGRTLEEYGHCFRLESSTLRGARILDVAAGVSSFCAEANEQGLNVTAMDVIYDQPRARIEQRCQPDLDQVVNSIASIGVYRWDFYKSPEGMRRFRERAYRRFLSDYESGQGKRYIFGMLPKTPFEDKQFNIALVSYLLFVYEDQLSYEFHAASILEIMRVTTDEARVYPVVTFEAERSRYLDRLRTDVHLSHLEFEEIATNFEFLANSNWFLRIRHKKKSS